MKNKDRMQFNLKNWEKRGFFGNFWDKNDKRATFKKILNKNESKFTTHKKEKIINDKETLKSETVLTDGKNYSSIKITPNSIELRVGKIRRSENEIYNH